MVYITHFQYEQYNNEGVLLVNKKHSITLYILYLTRVFSYYDCIIQSINKVI